MATRLSNLRSKRAAAVGMGLGVVLCSQLAFGTTIDFDVNDASSNTSARSVYTGAGAYSTGEPGTPYWNAVAVGANQIVNGSAALTSISSGPSVLDSTGAASTAGLTLTFDGSGTRRYYARAGTGGIPLLDTWAEDDAGTGVVTGSGSFSFAGLPVNSAYTLYLYSVNGGYQSRGTSFTIGTTTQNATGSSDTAFISGSNYVVFTGTTDSSGQVNGTFTASGLSGSTTNANAAFDGAQIVVPLPEPGSLCLLGLGAAGLLARRRRLRVALAGL